MQKFIINEQANVNLRCGVKKGCTCII